MKKQARSRVGSNEIILVLSKGGYPFHLIFSADNGGNLNCTPENIWLDGRQRTLNDHYSAAYESGINPRLLDDDALKMVNTNVTGWTLPGLTPSKVPSMRAIAQEPIPYRVGEIAAQALNLSGIRIVQESHFLQMW